jgi:membrane protein
VPDVEIEWRDVWVGALATAVLFTVGKFGLGIYLGRSEPGSAYGAAGALALLLVWIYYSAIILFLGAEFTQVWSRERGSGIEPADRRQCAATTRPTGRRCVSASASPARGSGPQPQVAVG